MSFSNILIFLFCLFPISQLFGQSAQELSEYTPEFNRMVESSDYIVKGEIVHKEDYTSGLKHVYLSEYTLKVYLSMKGSPPDTITFLSHGNSKCITSHGREFRPKMQGLFLLKYFEILGQSYLMPNGHKSFYSSNYGDIYEHNIIPRIPLTEVELSNVLRN